MTLRFFLIALFLFVAGGCGQLEETPNGIQANAFFVSPDGEDGNPGTIDQPWKTPELAVQKIPPGHTLYFREGTYRLKEQIRPTQSGQEGAWIMLAAYPGETPIIDAIDVKGLRGEGAIHLEEVSYYRIKGLTVRNSSWFGILSQRSHHIELYNNTVETTFSSGIAAWHSGDQESTCADCYDIKVLGNTIIDANTYETGPADYPRNRETPHEALSIASTANFEVAYNHVHHCWKEGIDVKETSRHGIVHHNYVHDLDRQGLYVDSWFGPLSDVEMYENVVHDNKGAGIAISTEEGAGTSNIRIHHNLVYNNLGTGIYFSRWGIDGIRTDIQIYNNTVHHNGHGTPASGQDYFWMTGGLYFFSPNLNDVIVRNNIFSDNNGFQIGYSDLYLKEGSDITEVFRQKNIVVEDNLLYETRKTAYPIYFGFGPDNAYFANVYQTTGNSFIEGDPRFVDPLDGNFYLQADSPASGEDYKGAFPPNATPDFWWKANFPPEFELE